MGIKSKLFKCIAILLIQATLLWNCAPVGAVSTVDTVVQASVCLKETLGPVVQLDKANLKDTFSLLQEEDVINEKNLEVPAIAPRKRFSYKISERILPVIVILFLSLTSIITIVFMTDISSPPGIVSVKDGEATLDQIDISENRISQEEVRVQRFDKYAQELLNDIDSYFGTMKNDNYFKRHNNNLMLKTEYTRRLGYRLADEQYLPSETEGDPLLRDMPRRRIRWFNERFNEWWVGLDKSVLPEYIRNKMTLAGDQSEWIGQMLIGVKIFDPERYYFLEEYNTRIVLLENTDDFRGAAQGDRFHRLITFNPRGAKLSVVKERNMFEQIGVLIHETVHEIKHDVPHGVREFLLKAHTEWGWSSLFGIPLIERKPLARQTEFFQRVLRLDVSRPHLASGYVGSRIILGGIFLLAWIIDIAAFLGLWWFVRKQNNVFARTLRGAVLRIIGAIYGIGILFSGLIGIVQDLVRNLKEPNVYRPTPSLKDKIVSAVESRLERLRNLLGNLRDGQRDTEIVPVSPVQEIVIDDPMQLRFDWKNPAALETSLGLGTLVNQAI
ncbi:MAG: hypothetical protein GY853_12490 [PVC group bacterium]|nr:hypothetical protein [PVC group bacterium]